MELYYSLSVLIVLASFFAYVNVRFLKLPSTIGIMVIAMAVSLILVVSGNIFPHTLQRISTLIAGFDFTELLMGAMLNFLLFAGAVHINLKDLREQRGPVMVFSTLSVIISTFAVGTLVYYIPMASLEIPYIYCLVFGALISPTDPVAVLSILKGAKVRKSLETKIAGESLFNDGVAVVAFAVILQLAQGKSEEMTVLHVLWLLLREAGGGFLLGVILGITASKAMRRIDDYKVSVLITLAVVMGGYLIARELHISGPLTMVFAGLIIGTFKRRTSAMSPVTKDYLDKFWELNDEILNAILFLFIGFNLLMMRDLSHYWRPGIACILIVLLARFISIWLPTKFIRFREKFSRGTIKILVWGGLRGGVSIALALSIDDGPHKKVIIAATYFVVVFSIIVQGLTIGKVANRILAKE
jgi:CPA1 family monovalent cation:H+ antiporter